jgi:polysaccharide deacetylase 2 family uncharacterized protein YibQ
MPCARQRQRQGAGVKDFVAGLLAGGMVCTVALVTASQLTLLPEQVPAAPRETVSTADPNVAGKGAEEEGAEEAFVEPAPDAQAATAQATEADVDAPADTERDVTKTAPATERQVANGADGAEVQVGATRQGGDAAGAGEEKTPATNGPAPGEIALQSDAASQTAEAAAGEPNIPRPGIVLLSPAAPTTEAAPAAADPPPPAPGTGSAAETPTAGLPAIERFARPLANPQGKPLFSILLIDSGDPKLDRARLAAAPFPVTFVLDPRLPDVATLAAPYLDAGQEVAMLAGPVTPDALPEAVAGEFAEYAQALPQAVAVVDQAEGGFQGNRPLATQIVQILKDQGRGLITYDAGLNAADQVARREAVRAGMIFRPIAPGAEPAGETRRTLDLATFKAAQDGRVAIIAPATPETIAALLEWSVEGRAAGVALAPATAVMTAP